MKLRFVSASIIAASISVVLIAQGTGTPNQIRVITDSTSALLTTIVAQTLPLSQPTVFSNTRVRTDATGALVVAATSGAAPSNATYITQTPDSTLSAEQALSTLSTGLLQATTTTGVVSSVADVATGQVLTSGTPPSYSANPTITSVRGPVGSATTTVFQLNAAGTGLYSGTSGVDFAVGGTRQGGVNSSGTLSIVNVVPTGVVSIGNDRPTITVSSGTTFAAQDSYIVLACTGAQNIATITGNAATTGVILWIEHTDTNCTLVDDDSPTAANALNLVGSANNAGAAGKVIGLIYNGTSWLQVAQSINN